MIKRSAPQKHFYLSLLTCVAVIGFSGPAMAQLDQQTGIADPSRVGDTFEERSILPDSGPAVNVRGLSPQGAPAGAENIRFVLRDINFEGATALPKSEIQKNYSDFLGTEITLAELYGIANRVTADYRNNGYILTRVVVPPQTIDGGTVRLQVVEGYINRIVIQGDETEAEALDVIRDYAAHISEGGALNVRDLERELLLINDLPGVSARTVLSPSDVPGAADMLIIVERDPWDALLTADNYGSRFLGPVQLGAAGTLNSYFKQNEAITAQVVIAPDSGYELAYGALSWEQPIGPYGTKIRAFGSMTDTKPGFTLDQFDVHGQSDLLSLQVTHPFVRSRNTNLSARASFDLRNVESANNIEDTRQDRIRAFRVGARYDFLERFLGTAVNAVDVQVSQGLNILGASEENRANLTRADGDPQFTKINAEIQRFQRLSDNFNLLMIGRGQLSNNPLLASEEFAVGGGASIGRGYDPSEISGDDGIAGSLELQWNSPYVTEQSIVDGYQLYGFLDYGKVWDQDATTSSEKIDSLTSLGGGVRVDFPQEIEVDFAVAFPISREVQTRNDKDGRVLVGVNKRF